MSIRPPLPIDASPVSGLPIPRRLKDFGRDLVPALAVGGVALITSLGLALLYPGQLPGWTVEHGPIESLTVIGYGIGGALALYLWPRLGAVAGLIALLALLMALREIDAHAAFTRFGIFSSRLYFRPDVPVAEKLGAGVAVLGLAGLLFWAVRRAWPRLLAEGGRIGISFGALVLVALLLKQLDALPRQLRRLGIPFDADTLALSRAIEEVGEAFLPALLVLVLVAALTTRTSPRA